MNSTATNPPRDTGFQPVRAAMDHQKPRDQHFVPFVRRTHGLEARVTGMDRKSRGFTLVEVLATVLLMAIIIPVVDKGLAAATLAAGSARHRTEAAGLAQSKLSELIVNSLWQSGNLSGDFGPNWPQYTWQGTVIAWPNDTQDIGLQELDVQILWTNRGQQQSVTVSSLVYVRPQPTS